MFFRNLVGVFGRHSLVPLVGDRLISSEDGSISIANTSMISIREDV